MCTNPLKWLGGGGGGRGPAGVGCVVNGPGEASEADIGIAGGDGEGLMFKKGKILRKVPEDQLLTELMKEIDKL